MTSGSSCPQSQPPLQKKCDLTALPGRFGGAHAVAHQTGWRDGSEINSRAQKSRRREPRPQTVSLLNTSSPLRYCPVEPCCAASVRRQAVHASCMLIRRGDDQSVGWFCRDEACRRESPRMPTTGSLPDQPPGVSSVAVSGTAVRTLITTTVTSSRSFVLPAKSVTALYRAATMLRAVSSQCCETT